MLKELGGHTATHRARQRHQRKRTAWRLVLISMFVVMALVISGFLYAWYYAKTHPVKQGELPLPKPSKITNASPAKDVSPDTPVGVAIESVSSPVKLGDNASLSVKTLPKATCNLRFTYKDGTISKDAGLSPKVADDFGIAAWTWTIEPARAAGTAVMEATCVHGKMSGYNKTDVVIQPQGAAAATTPATQTTTTPTTTTPTSP